jgi:hypothetical protein
MGISGNNMGKYGKHAGFMIFHAVFMAIFMDSMGQKMDFNGI